MIIFKHKETRSAKVALRAFHLCHISLSIFPTLILAFFWFYFSPLMAPLGHKGRYGVFQVDTQSDGISTLTEQLT